MDRWVNNTPSHPHPRHAPVVEPTMAVFWSTASRNCPITNGMLWIRFTSSWAWRNSFFRFFCSSLIYSSCTSRNSSSCCSFCEQTVEKQGWFQALLSQGMKVGEVWDAGPCAGSRLVLLIFFYWHIVDLQCCVSFRYTPKWISYTYTHSFFLVSFPI